MGLMDGKVVVITGAARGQGRAHALRFAEEGADVIAIDVCKPVETTKYPAATSEELAETAEGVRALGRRVVVSETDVRDAAEVKRVIDAGVAELGRLDAVVCNHGIATFCAADEMDHEHWSTMIDVNLNGPWHVCQASLPHLKDNGGAILFTASAASYVGFANCAHYSAAKAGLVGLMQSLAVELGPRGIRVNTIHPCTVDTPMALNDDTFNLFVPDGGLSASSDADRAQVAELFKAQTALNIPWIDPVDMANGALYLCSDLGRYVTGIQLKVDGGQGVK